MQLDFGPSTQKQQLIRKSSVSLYQQIYEDSAVMVNINIKNNIDREKNNCERQLRKQAWLRVNTTVVYAPARVRQCVAENFKNIDDSILWFLYLHYIILY